MMGQHLNPTEVFVRTGGGNQMLQHQLRKCETLSLNPSITKEKFVKEIIKLGMKLSRATCLAKKKKYIYIYIYIKHRVGRIERATATRISSRIFGISHTFSEVL
jgi:hypothetical protein